MKTKSEAKEAQATQHFSDVLKISHILLQLNNSLHMLL